MSEEPYRHLTCPLVVLRVSDPHVAGDTVADALRDELLAAYQHCGAVHAVVDLQQVTYISSAGIRPLLALHRQVRDRGGRLILTGLTTEVEGVLKVTRLLSGSGASPTAFEHRPDVLSAVAALYQAGPQAPPPGAATSPSP
jgi:anti-anti-sigma factor